MGVAVEVAMDCTPEAFWNIITAVERIGEFSPECEYAAWVEGFPAHAVGGRFEDRNRIEIDGDTYVWTRPCDVVTYDPPHEFAYTVGGRYDGTPTTRWSFRITPTGTGCVVKQQFEHLPDGLSGTRLTAEELEDADAHIARRRHDIQRGMTHTLDRIKSIVERPTLTT
jgi:hypothetical protein